MALGKKCKSSLKSKRGGDGGGGVVAAAAAEAEAEGLELGFVKYTRAFGRKRIGITNNGEGSLGTDFSPKTPVKRQRSGKLVWGSETSALEALPQEILVKIVCGVDHEDLKQLFHVSKPIREATLIAKEWHFAFSTPSKTPAFRTAIDYSDASMDEIEAPNAPRQWRQQHRPMISRNKLADISVNLFADFMDEDE